MNVRHLFAAALFTLGVSLAASSQAALVTWDLENVVFNDGGTASGSFTFDTVNDLYTAWSLTTTATTMPYVDNFYTLNGTTYTTNSGSPSAMSSFNNKTTADFVTPGSTASLGFIFAQSLISGATTINVTGSEREGFNTRLIASGEVVSAVPLPASLPMFGAGILGLVGMGMMKSRRTRSV